MTGRPGIPFLDLGALHASIAGELREAFDRVVAESSFIGGGELSALEEEFAAAHGRAHGVGCASGTDAISLALHAAGIGPGHEVVVPAMTFVATAEAVVHAGATPVVADVDPETLLLSPEAVAAVAGERTAAVVPVHLYGHPVPFTHLERWRSEGLVVVEDAAQAHLARWRGRPVGTPGHAACFSFFPGKNLGALGDAGMVLTDDDALAATVRRRRNHGRSDKYRHDELGVASRLDGLQAAFLRVKLRHLAAWTDTRRRLAARYRAGIPAGGPARLVPWEEGAVHHLVCLRTAPADRDPLREWLAASGVATGVHYPIDLSAQPATARFAPAPCPEARRAASELVSLPVDPMMSDHDVDLVCERVRAYPGAATRAAP